MSPITLSPQPQLVHLATMPAIGGQQSQQHPHSGICQYPSKEAHTETSQTEGSSHFVCQPMIASTTTAAPGNFYRVILASCPNTNVSPGQTTLTTAYSPVYTGAIPYQAAIVNPNTSVGNLSAVITSGIPNTCSGLVAPSSSGVDATTVCFDPRYISVAPQQRSMSWITPSPPQLSYAVPSEIGALSFSGPGNPLINSTNMEVVWHGSFDDHFRQFLIQNKHFWRLEPLSHDEDPCALASHPGVVTFKDSAKVRFLCKECGNAWTSMKGRVIFWIRLCYHQATFCETPAVEGNGLVQFRLFGQRCQKCNSEHYENAMWYPEEVVKVVKNVYQHVGRLYYNFAWPTVDATRRMGRPRTQHNASHCQACAAGICNENRDNTNKITYGMARLTVQPATNSPARGCQPASSKMSDLSWQQKHQQQQMQASPTVIDR